MAEVELRAIAGADVPAVCNFLRVHLNSRVSASQWRSLFDPPWSMEAPNHGFQLVMDGQILGVYAAVYSERMIDGSVVAFCNLAAFCVREEYRVHSMRLLRAILAQKGYVFTDLSPSGNVVALNQRLGFLSLDPSTELSVNLPARRRSGIRVTSDSERLAAALQGEEAELYRDHQDAPAARHVLATCGDAWAYLVIRRDRRKRLPLFATPLHAGGDLALLARAWPQVASHLLLRFGMPVLLSDPRVLGFHVPRARLLAVPRPRMVRGIDRIEAVDYLYSELALVGW